MKIGTSILVGLALTLVCGGRAHAEIAAQFDYFAVTGMVYSELFYTNYRIMQTFVAEKTGTVTAVDSTIHRATSAATLPVTFKIYALTSVPPNGLQPTGAPLSTGVLAAADAQFNTMFISWKRVGMTPMVLVAGTQYGLVVDTGFTNPFHYEWYTRVDDYTNGNLSISTGGTYAQQYDDDVPFRIVVNEYPLTTIAVNGTVAKNPNAAYYTNGAVVSLTATPNDGYHFVGWSGSITGSANPENVTVSSNTSVTAAFALNAVTVLTDRASVTVPEGGSNNFWVRLSAQPTASVTVATAWISGDSDIAVTAGSSRTFSTANWNDYQTVTLSASEDAGDNANGSATIRCGAAGAVSCDVAALEADDDFTLSVDVDSTYGAVVVSPNLALYDNGTLVTLTAFPAASYFFSSYGGDLDTTDNPAYLTMDGNKSVETDFGFKKPDVLPPVGIARRKFVARWKWAAGGAPEGELCVASNAAFTQPVAGYEARYMLNDAVCTVTNLAANRDYWYRVRRIVPEGGYSAWSGGMKVRTGTGMPYFSNLLSDGPVSPNVTQQFALSNLVAGTGVVTVKSSNTNAVLAGISGGLLTLQYRWKNATTAKITLTLKHAPTLHQTAYAMSPSKAAGNVAKLGVSALTNAGKRVTQDITLENRCGATIYGIRVRVAGLDKATWLVNRTGLDPVASGVAIREIPCVLPPGSQAVVRLVYNSAYTNQAATRPVRYSAAAILPPLNGTAPLNREMANVERTAYDGVWLLNLPAIRNRYYAISCSDTDGSNWTEVEAALQATTHHLQWLDGSGDVDAASNRLYRVEDVDGAP